MHPAIQENRDLPRGCGVRDRAGRMYLVSLGKGRGCGKLPIPLGICPCCGMGFKFSRTPQWIEQPESLWFNRECGAGDDHCRNCPMSRGYETGAALLMWIGKEHYPTPQAFNAEAEVMGISRYIQHVPKNFIVGETWVLMAHIHGIDAAPINSAKPDWKPAIFRMFRPDRIEVMVDGTEPDTVIEDYLKRNLTPVMVYRPQPAPETDASQPPLLPEEPVL